MNSILPAFRIVKWKQDMDAPMREAVDWHKMQNIRNSDVVATALTGGEKVLVLSKHCEIYTLVAGVQVG